MKVRVQKAEGSRQQAEGQPEVEKSRSQGVEKKAAVPSTKVGEGKKETSTDHSPLTTYRLFFALRVPSEIATPLAEAQKGLRGNWRAVNPGQMHVTLCYLPSVPPGRVDDLKRLGTRLMQELPPTNIKLRGTGYFPNEGSPRVWFVKVEAEGLTELAANLRAGVQELGLETDDLPFKAHITLARKKGPAPRVPPLTFDLGWTATAGTLYRSILRKTGPIYEVESTFRFRGNPPPPLSLRDISPLNGEREEISNPPGHAPQAHQEQT